MIFVEEMLVEKLLSLKNPATPLKIAGWKTGLSFQNDSFFLVQHVNFPGCIHLKFNSSPLKSYRIPKGKDRLSNPPFSG